MVAQFIPIIIAISSIGAAAGGEFEGRLTTDGWAIPLRPAGTDAERLFLVSTSASITGVFTDSPLAEDASTGSSLRFSTPDGTGVILSPGTIEREAGPDSALPRPDGVLGRDFLKLVDLGFDGRQRKWRLWTEPRADERAFWLAAAGRPAEYPVKFAADGVALEYGGLPGVSATLSLIGEAAMGSPLVAEAAGALPIRTRVGRLVDGTTFTGRLLLGKGGPWDPGGYSLVIAESPGTPGGSLGLTPASFAARRWVLSLRDQRFLVATPSPQERLSALLTQLLGFGIAIRGDGAYFDSRETLEPMGQAERLDGWELLELGGEDLRLAIRELLKGGVAARQAALRLAERASGASFEVVMRTGGRTVRTTLKRES